MTTPRVLVAGLRGGSGKTLLAVGLEDAWRRQGLQVAPFKKGPDYIDAAWSSSAAGRPCRNLDLFLHSPDAAVRSFVDGAAGADVAVIEGNRGLFDGADARGSYSSAELAKLLNAPVVLVVDCTKATRTVAAAVLGCRHLDPEVDIRGVVLNQISGLRHEEVVRAAIADATGLPVLGALPRINGDILPERHLGLLPPAEHGAREEAVREVGELAERYMDLDEILAIARRAPALDRPLEVRAAPGPGQGAAEAEEAPFAGVRIGVFRDAAFQFYYPENLEALERAGAELVEISPLRDRSLPEVNGLYLGGGFPETQAEGLSANRTFRSAVRDAAMAGMPMYAECGGAVYLGQDLDYRGGRYPMVGVFPVAFGFQERPRGHGYAVLEAVEQNPYYGVGDELRGHEFHYTFMRAAPVMELTFAFRVRRGYGFDGEHDGLCRHNVMACYTHIHALTVPQWAPALVRAAGQFRWASIAAVAAR